MRKVIIFALLCILLLFVPSITVGMTCNQSSEKQAPFWEWTFLQGMITRPKRVRINGYWCFEFNALFVHYRTHWFGNIRSGFFHRFERFILPVFHYGLLGSHFVFARWDVGLAPY